MTVTVKLDTQKIRVFIHDKSEVLNKIVLDLQKNGYNDIRESKRCASELNGLSASGYSLSSYSMAYRLPRSQNTKPLVIEAWLPLMDHYKQDKPFSEMLNSLYAHLIPTMDVNIEATQSTMLIAELSPRNYVTVFEQNDVSLDGVMTLIRNLESVVSQARDEADMTDGPRILSEVKIAFDPIKVYAAKQVAGLIIFGNNRQNPAEPSDTNSSHPMLSV
ncbi:MAG: hypothetical protein P4L79_03140 [Legionella sp.]|uniref:hypothetical protein n=1 Tax=Legionella sp. TaxID=459 RepID=UPI00284B171B|nr:hypothetical protein [Legionella sp.]